MKKKSTSQSAFFNLRILTGLFLGLAGVSLALLGFGQFSAQAQQRDKSATTGISALVPPAFDCAQFHALGLNMQENLRAGAIAIYCGQAVGGSPDAEGEPMSFAQEILAPLLGGTDVDLITGADTGTHITQSETFVSANPNNPNEIVVAYNDSRNVASSPINISSASVSTDGGATFTRLTKANGHSPFENTLGDPVVLYNSASGTWFTVWLDLACGGQGLGGYKSTTPADPNSWIHFCAHTGSGDDRESGFADNSPSSPFVGNMYVSWNDFAVGGSLKVRRSTDNGLTWGTEKILSAGFIRDVQITGDPATGAVYVAGMDEGAGGLGNRTNKIFKSTDGGNTWITSFTGTAFPAPGRTLCPNSFFACMFTSTQGGYWRHQGWGQPAALNDIVHYVYDSRNTGNGDPANVFYIRSINGGVTFSAPLQLNTDTTIKAQWQPNISVAADGSLLAVWYDEREATATCVKGNTGVPCYRMWARKSLDGGVTWQPDEAFSDVLSPLPGQPDSSIVTEYVGDYDYSNTVGNTHLHPWTDGRVAVNSASQQDAFFDQEGGGGGGEITLSARARSRGTNNQVLLKWDPADGGSMNVLRDNVIVQTTADDGRTGDNLGTSTGTFTYQVCETDSGDCSNEVVVTVP
jgi:hypothetical protein